MNKYRVGLGVSGGIAAYKAVEVMRLLQKSGCEVSVAMTRHATEFVQPLTFRALTDKHVIVDDYDPENPDPIAHINFSHNIDLLLIVPATANIIGKFANGIADDFLTSTYLASTAPVLIAPAMNTTMWEHPATRRNVAQLKADGVFFIEPDDGEMACGTIGPGRLSHPERIVSVALEILGETGQGLSTSGSKPAQDLIEERVLITAGATREPIDPVRFISNRSSGKMGFALARAAIQRGAQVRIVAGITTVAPPSGVELIEATSAEDMRAAVFREIEDATIFIAAAAVADYRTTHSSPTKIKKSDAAMILELERTPDILSEMARRRKNGQLLVGFAAETDDVTSNAQEKLSQKHLDMVVANDVSREGSGFDSDSNAVTILVRDNP